MSSNLVLFGSPTIFRWHNQEEVLREKRVGSLMNHATINSNLIYSLFLSSALVLHVRDALGTCLWGHAIWEASRAAYKSGGLQAVVLAESPKGQFMTKPTVRWVLVTLSRSCDVGVLAIEVRVDFMGVRGEK